MPKLKSSKALKKRVKVTKNGKLKVHKPGKGHLLSGKSSKRKRGMRKATTIHKALEKKLRNLT